MGNVQATVSDNKFAYGTKDSVAGWHPALRTAYDYYPFGMLMPKFFNSKLMTNPFPYSIKEEITFEKIVYPIFDVFDCKVILLDWEQIPEGSPDFGRNVAGLNESGNVVWQIEPLSMNLANSDSGRLCYYTGIKSIYLGDIRAVLLYNACDVNVLVNYKTGKVIEKKVMNNPFPYPIYEEITIDSYRIVLLDWQKIPDNSSDVNRNVACIDEFGNIVWQIEPFPDYPGTYSKDSCCYVGIDYIDNQLLLFNSCDLRVEVDYKTGKVLGKKEIR